MDERAREEVPQYFRIKEFLPNQRGGRDKCKQFSKRPGLYR